MTPSAKVIADSISPTGSRLTTLEVVMHRFVLAEFNTHRVFSRNSASSRAIPVEKTLDRVSNDPAMPVFWACEQPGMQGGSELADEDLLEAQQLFYDIYYSTLDHIGYYVDQHPQKRSRLHKSLINRLLEPFMWHTVVVTSTEWQGFWDQRCHPDAQPEIRAAADAMKIAYDESEPDYVDYGEWHLPYIDSRDYESVKLITMHGAYPESDTDLLKKMSVARCARVSTLNQDGKKSIEDDLKLYDRLVTATPPHASPLEHVATPVHDDSDEWYKQVGNFSGWRQLRHEVLGV